MAAAQDIFTPASLTVKQLFNNSDSLYQIPRYQRPYKWGDEQIDKLWDDLTEAYGNQTESYFLGSVITAAPKDTSSYLDVVDGQQRITTLMILFTVVRDLFPSLNRNPANPDPSNITSKTIKYRTLSILAGNKNYWWPFLWSQKRVLASNNFYYWPKFRLHCPGVNPVRFLNCFW